MYAPHDGVAVRVQVAILDVGLLYVLAVGALSVYGVVLGSWASNNKYAFYGGMRAAAQMLSYEIPLGLAILVVVLTTGELRLERIVAAQTATFGGWLDWLPKWNVLLHPLAFVILFTASLAETNRAPFDLAECEQELVGGFHTEYSSMKFALFFVGEYTHVLVSSAFMTVLFFGGWHLPGIREQYASLWGVLLQMAVMAAKIGAFVFLFMLVRWTFPRFRFDQLMRMTWKGMVPLGMAQVALTCVLVYFNDQSNLLWALGCDVLLVVVVMAWLVLRPSEISGRQTHLAPVDPGRSTAAV